MSLEKVNEFNYEILEENYPKCDMKFKIIVIGNQLCWKIMFSISSHKKTIY